MKGRPGASRRTTWRSAARVVRFGLVGVCATLVYLTVALLAAAIGLQPVSGHALAFAASTGISYVGHRFFTFHALRDGGSGLLRFLVQVVVSAGLSTLIAAAAAHQRRYELGLAANLVAIPAINFLLMQYWVFRQPENARARGLPQPCSNLDEV